MLLTRMKLNNFRQFIGEQLIEFTTDEMRNVTIIMGENASGKTTLAQAFTWCLYGITDFDDKSMLNLRVAERLLPSESDRVRVELGLTHGDIDYNIIREQLYYRDKSGELKAQNPSFNITQKIDGQQKFLKHTEVDVHIKQILPQELSKYFFFDGERIDKMSKEITKGRSQEFAEAVKGLLGLNALQAALDHLKPTSKSSLIGYYNQSYDTKSDERIAKYSREIENTQDRIDKIDERLGEIEGEVDLASERIKVLTEELKALRETEELQEKKEKYRKDIESLRKLRSTVYTSLLKEFNSDAKYFFSKPLIGAALKSLAKADKIDKGIPDMKASTIDFLLKRGYCICGNKIDSGNEAYNELLKVRNYLPPQSIGMELRQFGQGSRFRVETADKFFERFGSFFNSMQGYGNQIGEIIDEINFIDNQIKGKKSAAGIHQELKEYERVIRDRQDERDELNKEKGSLETSRDRKETERKELTLRDEKNKKIEVYKAYAQYIYGEIALSYKKNEAKTREELENNINEIFKNIYEGGLSLSIDANYNIRVSLDEDRGYKKEVETSTAQNISIILSFIAGIIKMASEKAENDDQNNIIESESYPLVMDAPLSAFDKRRIKTVCEVLPNVAKQVIIFIKDTDGELAEENMGNKVGKRYLFLKKDEIETNIQAR